MTPFWVYFTLVAYAILGTVVAYLSRRNIGRGMTEFFLANRTIGGLLGALTYSATTYSAFMMIGLAGYTYKGGVGALGFELIYLSGLVLAVFFGPRFWLAGQRYGYISPAEMLAHRFQSSWVGMAAALAALVFLIPYSAVQLMGIGYLLNGLSHGAIPYLAGILIAGALAIIWAWIAGLRSVAWTDALQSIVMIIAAAGVLFYAVYHLLGGWTTFTATLEQDYPQWLTVPGPGFFNFQAFLGLTLPWFFFCLSNPQVSQRLFAPPSLRSMRVMLRGFLVFGFLYTLISVLWGFSTLVLEPGLKSPDMATPTLLGSAGIPPALALIAMAGIMAAAISTIDSILLTLSSMFARDVYRPLRPSISEDQELAVGKFIIPVITAAALAFAYLRLDLIATLSVAASTGLLVTVPATFAVFFWKRATAAGALASIAGGALVALYLQFGRLQPLGIWPGVWTLLASTALLLLVSFLSPPPTGADAYVEGIKKELEAKQVL